MSSGGHGHNGGQSDDYISLHKKKHEYAKRAVETHKHHSSAAYLKAVEEHLLDDNEQVDIDRLQEEDVQEKFAKTITDYHLDKAKKAFGIKELKTDHHAAQILQAYMGSTPQLIQETVKTYGSQLNHDFYHQRIIPQLTQQVQRLLYQTSTSHIKQEHVAGITKKLGIEEKLAAPLNVDEAKEVLNAWQENGEELTDSILRTVIGSKMKSKKKKGATDGHADSHHH